MSGVVLRAHAVAVFEVDGAAFVEGVGWIQENLLPFTDAVFLYAEKEVASLVVGPFAADAAGFGLFGCGDDGVAGGEWCCG